jgi:membrane protease YdiL (CAAX protease family)
VANRQLLFSLLLAAAFWFVMFFPGLGMEWNFWAVMTAASLILTALAVCFGGWPQLRLTWQEVALGVGIAIVLWCVFWTGDKCSQWLFDFARPQVDLIYGIKSGTPPMLIGLLLLIIIGPGEEIFWRGYVQRSLCDFFMEKRRSIPLTLARRHAHDAAFVLATAAYTLIHVPSLNFMLIMAALVCGVVWGGLYRLMPQHFTAIVVSHALWDAAAFVWFPF